MVESSCKIISGIVIACCLFWVVLTVFLISFSFSIVEADEYGVVFSKFKQQLQNETKTSGRYFLGIGKTFKIFPRRYILVEFAEEDEAIADPLSCFTYEGLGVYIDLSYYFRLEKDQIHEMYLAFGDYWYANIVRKSYASIKEVCPNYETTEFFSLRQEIAENLKEYIQEQFEEAFLGAVVIESLQLRGITFDDPLEEAITDKLIEKINLRVYEIRYEATQIEKEKELIENWAENNITLIDAEAEVLAIGQTEYAKADALNLILNQIATSYDSLNSIIGLSPDQELLQFIHAAELAELANTKKKTIYLGLDEPVLNYWANSQAQESFSDDSKQSSSDDSDDSSDGGSTSGSSSDDGNIEDGERFSDYSGSWINVVSTRTCILIFLAVLFC